MNRVSEAPIELDLLEPGHPSFQQRLDGGYGQPQFVQVTLDG